MHDAPATGTLDGGPRPAVDSRTAERLSGGTIWAYVGLVGRRILAWAGLSALIAVFLVLLGDAFGRGLGLAIGGWGLIDAGLGLAARTVAARGRRLEVGDRVSDDRVGRRIRRGLLAGAVVDVAVMAAGAGLLAAPGGDAFRLGAAWGVIVQGAFLFAFDLLHARWIPGPAPVFAAGIPLFAGPEHLPLRLDAIAPDGSPARSRDAAILLHGFAGTPAELRGLAGVLARDGWMVELPLLPGHGPQIEALPDRRVEDWLAEVEAAAARLRTRGATRILVIGHSMGAALALASAPTVRPDGLALLAPFWWEQARWQRGLGPVMRWFLPPGFKVFRKLDLDAPEVRRGLVQLLPGLDLDDADTVAGLRELTVPMALFEQLFRVSRLAVSAAPAIDCPVLAVQGLEDKLVLPGRTRRLLSLLRVDCDPVEVVADHDLLTDASPARDEVQAAVLGFAATIRAPTPADGLPN